MRSSLQVFGTTRKKGNQMNSNKRISEKETKTHRVNDSPYAKNLRLQGTIKIRKRD